ncbi:MAG: DNA primase catalytic subunit PriS [Methanosarcinales archaeon Met12]|nr:MAG: DNA primase catalytic subunit PriS [Methanosarcinales archaeon Met12]
MKVETKEFIQYRFREYYQSASIQLPPQFEKREWGFIFFDDAFPDVVMRRHKSFMARGEAVDYVRNKAPAHAFHSAAYYVNPEAPTMQEKKWQGADLIFDLDADHLKLKWTTYGDMLQKVKEETIKLIGFLTDDFGFEDNDIEVVFSGGRGYHIHVRDSRIIGLGSSERREVVDYITATGLEVENFLYPKEVTGDADETGRRKTVKSLRFRSGGSGWGLRLHKALKEFLDNISSMDENKALEEIKKVEGISERMAEMLLKVVKDKSSMKRLKEGNFDQIRKFPNSFWEDIIKRQKIELKGHPDEPVTADTKRLIRLPTSLHGGSSFQAMPLTLNALDDFNPLSDAVVFGDELTVVNVTKASDVEIKDKRYNIVKGIHKLPEHLAVFLMCRGVAEYGP